MPRPDDHCYYSRRTAEELERGDQASNATVAAIHYTMANRYSILAAKAATGKRSLTVVHCDKKQIAA